MNKKQCALSGAGGARKTVFKTKGGSLEPACQDALNNVRHCRGEEGGEVGGQRIMTRRREQSAWQKGIF